MEKLKESMQMASISKMKQNKHTSHALTGTLKDSHSRGVVIKDGHAEKESMGLTQGPNPFDFAHKDIGSKRQVEMYSNDSMSKDGDIKSE